MALAGKGVLITGPSGAGKSSLALRLIAAGGRLVADDRVLVVQEAGLAIARPAPRLAGWIEVRGGGLARLAYDRAAVLALVAVLTPDGPPDRLPEPALIEIAGVALPQLAIDPAAPQAVEMIWSAAAAQRFTAEPAWPFLVEGRPGDRR